MAQNPGTGMAEESALRNQLQEKFMQMEYLKGQAENIQQQASMVVNSINELQVAKSALKNIKDVSEGSEILVPLGAGAYATATLKRNKTVIMSLGADVLADKSIEEAISIVESQIAKLEEAHEKMAGGLSEINENLRTLTPEVQVLAKKLHVG